MKIGSKLKMLRKGNRLSLKELSSMTGVSISFLSDIEHERSNPSLETLEVIAKNLGVPIASFFNVPDSPFDSALKSAYLSPVLDLLQDFKDWSEDDKQELLCYLKAKQLIRNKKE